MRDADERLPYLVVLDQRQEVLVELWRCLPVVRVFFLVAHQRVLHLSLHLLYVAKVDWEYSWHDIPRVARHDLVRRALLSFLVVDLVLVALVGKLPWEILHLVASFRCLHRVRLLEQRVLAAVFKVLGKGLVEQDVLQLRVHHLGLLVVQVGVLVKMVRQNFFLRHLALRAMHVDDVGGLWDDLPALVDDLALQRRFQDDLVADPRDAGLGLAAARRHEAFVGRAEQNLHALVGVVALELVGAQGIDERVSLLRARHLVDPWDVDVVAPLAADALDLYLPLLWSVVVDAYFFHVKLFPAAVKITVGIDSRFPVLPLFLLAVAVFQLALAHRVLCAALGLSDPVHRVLDSKKTFFDPHGVWQLFDVLCLLLLHLGKAIVDEGLVNLDDVARRKVRLQQFRDPRLVIFAKANVVDLDLVLRRRHAVPVVRHTMVVALRLAVLDLHQLLLRKLAELLDEFRQALRQDLVLVHAAGRDRVRDRAVEQARDVVLHDGVLQIVVLLVVLAEQAFHLGAFAGPGRVPQRVDTAAVALALEVQASVLHDLVLSVAALRVPRLAEQAFLDLLPKVPWQRVDARLPGTAQRPDDVLVANLDDVADIIVLLLLVLVFELPGDAKAGDFAAAVDRVLAQRVDDALDEVDRVGLWVRTVAVALDARRIALGILEEHDFLLGRQPLSVTSLSSKAS